jgi:hypothetical protein
MYDYAVTFRYSIMLQKSIRFIVSASGQSQSQSYITTDSQSVCLGVEPNLGLLTRDLTSLFCFLFLKVTVLSFGGALSDERSGLSYFECYRLYREPREPNCKLFPRNHD